jgi:hypothetical protein
VGAPGSGFAGLSAGERDRARAAGAHGLSTVGVESEAELAFAGLHQLLIPFGGLAERPGRAQWLALAAALGLIDAADPDPFLIAAAAFALLGEAARQNYLGSYAGRRFAEWTATCAPTRTSCRRWPSCCGRSKSRSR